jgi:hypothetical protein
LARGVYLFASGDLYTGEFKNGYMEGQGVLVRDTEEVKG